jgi:hypothetical protein
MGDVTLGVRAGGVDEEGSEAAFCSVSVVDMED